MQHDMLNRQLMDATPDRALRQITDKLRESEYRYRRAFEISVVGIALVQPGGRWLELNRTLCELAGYSMNPFEVGNLEPPRPQWSPTSAQWGLILLLVLAFSRLLGIN